MRLRKLTCTTLSLAIGLAPLAGCENLPGNKKEQGAVIGGVGGAVAGAAIAKNNRGLGALIGGALGAGGGYLIGANLDKHDKDKDKTRDDAIKASQDAQKHPATAADVKDSSTADLNDDGFVTLDEVVAMKDAGLSDKEMIKRLERTQQYFELTDEQTRYLRDRGVDDKVVQAMRDMRPDQARTASDSQSDSNVDMRTNPR
jgi:hypothetical protein